MGVRVTDGHGVQLDMTVDLYVYAADEAAPAPALPARGNPSVGQADAVAPMPAGRSGRGTVRLRRR